MLWQLNRPKLAPQSTNGMVEKWLQQRQKVLVLLNQLAGSVPKEDAENDQDVMQQLNNFCELLVDYASQGHFSVYERLADSMEQKQTDLVGLDREALVKIERTTDALLDFNELVDANKSGLKIREELSSLSEQLATRFELEDQLVRDYLQVCHPEAMMGPNQTPNSPSPF